MGRRRSIDFLRMDFTASKLESAFLLLDNLPKIGLRPFVGDSHTVD
jgi:hypothetical protein